MTATDEQIPLHVHDGILTPAKAILRVQHKDPDRPSPPLPGVASPVPAPYLTVLEPDRVADPYAPRPAEPNTRL